MKRLIECVPNFSEGRDPAKVDAIVQTMSSVPGVYVLDREMDADHNRCVITLAGEPDAVGEAAIQGAGKALELIDMTTHTGAHPRVGATDVLALVEGVRPSVADAAAGVEAFAAIGAESPPGGAGRGAGGASGVSRTLKVVLTWLVGL